MRKVVSLIPGANFFPQKKYGTQPDRIVQAILTNKISSRMYSMVYL